MCGVAAVLSSGSEPDQESLRVVRAMTRALAHRGPDGEGFDESRYAQLGHRRLAILDLETGGQPMRSADGDVRVVFNGEIYNHHELRRELEARGHVFRTRSDTEVLVEGYRAWGTGLCAKLLGMFAFLAHDQKSGETLLARDPLGKKPLCWLEKDGLLYVASEVGAFLRAGVLAARPDAAALRELCALRYVPGDATLFAACNELAPGHFALHRPGESLVPRAFFSARFDEVDPRPAAELVAELSELLDRAVDARLEADVPLGAFLSSGIDSAGVVASIARGGRCVQTVTVGFGAGDESVAASELAQRLGLAHRVARCEPDAAQDLGTLAAVFGEPLLDSSLWPTWLVSRATRENVSVALSGDGGDESFGGYRRYRFDLAENRVRGLVPRRFARALASLWPKADWLPRPLRAKRSLANLAVDPAEAYFRSVSALLPEEVAELMRPEHGAGTDVFRGLRDRWGRCTAPDHATRILELDLHTYLPGDILRKVDRCSMAVALETRAPLLDRRIVEFAGRLPRELKYDTRRSKRILREVLEPRLGAAWLSRRKRGFTIPLGAWLRGPLAGRLRAALDGEFAREWFEPTTLRRWAREHASGIRDRSEALWAVLALDLWQREWGGGGAVA